MGHVFSPAVAKAAAASVDLTLQRRKTPRHSIAARGHLTLPGRAPFAVKTTDLSRGGAGLEHDEPAAGEGTKGSLTLSYLMGSELVRLEFLVEIRYTRMARMMMHTGVAFVNVPASMQRQLNRLLETRPVLVDI